MRRREIVQLNQFERLGPCQAMTKLGGNPDKMGLRRGTVEASIRHNKVLLDGSDALPDENLKNVSTEMALHVVAYNMKRVMRILCVGGLMERIRA